MQQVVVHKGRTTTITVKLPYDVSQDVITSQVRAGKTQDDDLLGEWAVSNLTDGEDGELVLVFDDSESNLVDRTIGYMDLKRMSAGEPLTVFDEPLEVLFEDTITA